MAGRSLESLLASIRARGWVVAVHNDYTQNGCQYTFWLFTHPNGRWAKGEGEDDAVAVCNAMEGMVDA